MRAALAAILLASATTSLHAAPAQDASSSSSLEVRAMALAKTLQPADLVVNSSMKQLDGHFVAAIAASPDGKVLEAKFPGIVDAMYAAARPHLQASLSGKLPTLWEKSAALFAANLSPEDMALLEEFYAGPTGQKMLRSAFSNVNAGEALAKMAANPEKGVTQSMVNELQGSAINAAISSIDESDTAALAKFQSHPAAYKLLKLKPQMDEIMLGMAQNPDPESEKRVSAVMIKAVQDFMAKAGASK